jgi:hypothetical protein
MDSIANRKQNPLQQQTSSLETYKIGPLSINAFLVSLQYYKVHFWKRMVSVCLTLSQFTNLVLLFVGLLHDINRFLLFVINVRNQSTKPPKLLVFVASFILCCCCCCCSVNTHLCWRINNMLARHCIRLIQNLRPLSLVEICDAYYFIKFFFHCVLKFTKRLRNLQIFFSE